MADLCGVVGMLVWTVATAVSLAALIAAVVTVPDVLRAAWVLWRRPVQGLVDLDGTPLTSYLDGAPAVVRQLIVSEKSGKRSRERHRSLDAVPFVVREARGAVRLDASTARILSGTQSTGPPTPPILARVGDVFSRVSSRKRCVETTVRPGDFVTVSAEHAGADGLAGSMWIVVGEPRLLATTEARTVLAGAAMTAAWVAGMYLLSLLD
jgi:hypothetical protein